MKKLPNVLTIIRIFLSFLLLLVLTSWENFAPSFIHISWRDYFSCLIFCIASSTDFFDGYIARELNVKSFFGEIFDPLADKILILSAFIGLLHLNRVNEWAVFLILGREFFITGLRLAIINKLNNQKNINLGANYIGKYKTGFQILAIGFLLADFFPGGDLLLWIAVFFTIYSGFTYTLSYIKLGTKV